LDETWPDCKFFHQSRPLRNNVDYVRILAVHVKRGKFLLLSLRHLFGHHQINHGRWLCTTELFSLLASPTHESEHFANLLVCTFVMSRRVTVTVQPLPIYSLKVETPTI
jgi:hypothetical protein